MGVRIDITDGSSAPLARLLLCPINAAQGEWCQEGGSMTLGHYGRGRYGWVQQTSRIWLFEPGPREGTGVFLLRLHEIFHGLAALLPSNRGPCDFPPSLASTPAPPGPKGSSGGAKGATDPYSSGGPPPPGAPMIWIVTAVNVADNCTGRGTGQQLPQGWFDSILERLHRERW